MYGKQNVSTRKIYYVIISTCMSRNYGIRSHNNEIVSHDFDMYTSQNYDIRSHNFDKVSRNIDIHVSKVRHKITQF